MSELDRALFDRYLSAHYADFKPASVELYESYARHYERVFLPILPQDRSATIVDVGCGSGHFLYFLKAHGYLNCEGIDVSLEQVAECRRFVSATVEHVEDTRAYLGERGGHYAAIVSIDVFEHLEDAVLLATVEAFRGALRPGGQALISVPNAACITALATRYGDLTHKRLFTERSLQQLLRAGGFDNVRILPNEKRVVRSFRSRRERWLWELRDQFVRWLLNEFHVHLMEGSVPQVQTVNLLAVATKDLEDR